MKRIAIQLFVGASLWAIGYFDHFSVSSLVLCGVGGGIFGWGVAALKNAKEA